MEYMRIQLIMLVLILHGTAGVLSEGSLLVLDYYKETCPLVEEIVRRNVEIAVLREPRMAASLLRLHFHDCFVMGCDGSILLDTFGDMISEKLAGPNLNSVRGFKVIDNIKYLVEEACPYTVSCADILAIVARDAVVLRGGPRWEVWLGRKDSLKASFVGANQFIPIPNSSLETLIGNFKQQGLNVRDLVTLAGKHSIIFSDQTMLTVQGGHTMGKARCVSFRQRIYEKSIEENFDHYKRYTTYRRILQSICPESGRDNTLAALDFRTPTRFDNLYFQNIIEGKGLLHSDNVLVNEDLEGEIREQVWAYASNEQLFFDSFVNSILKMGNINVLTGNEGEIRKNCRFVNP